MEGPLCFSCIWSEVLHFYCLSIGIMNNILFSKKYGFFYFKNITETQPQTAEGMGESQRTDKREKSLI